MTTDEPEQGPAAKPCPVCARPAVARFRPFCSKRCADIDLHRWFSGVYAVPAVEAEELGDEEEPESGLEPGQRGR
jgi:endogenous inhibitor of DNA gyrase (YacG/DUF329 family)